MLPEKRLHRLLLLGGGIVAAVAAGALLFPSAVYDRFIWKHLWGPIAADAANQASVTFHGVVAHRGYTVVSELVYGLILLYTLLVLIDLVRAADIATDRRSVLAFAPFVVFGGLLRVVEDTGAVTGASQYLLISPLIYLTMAAAVIGTAAVAVALQRRGAIQDWTQFVAVGGGIAAVGAAGLLFLLEPVDAWWMLSAGIGSAAVLTGVTLAVVHAIDRWPQLSTVTTWLGATTLFGHLLDGTATAFSIEVLGYGEKHPVVEFFINVTGTAYTFPLLKAAVIVGILALIPSPENDDDPLFTNLVLLGILALGLGPGTRNLARAVFGV